MSRRSGRNQSLLTSQLSCLRISNYSSQTLDMRFTSTIDEKIEVNRLSRQARQRSLVALFNVRFHERRIQPLFLCSLYPCLFHLSFLYTGLFSMEGLLARKGERVDFQILAILPALCTLQTIPILYSANPTVQKNKNTSSCSIWTRAPSHPVYLTLNPSC